MNTARLRQARRLFCSQFVPRQVNRANVRAWVRSVRSLGDKWVAVAEPTHGRPL